MANEIERKYILKNTDMLKEEINRYPSYEIKQGYLGDLAKIEVIENNNNYYVAINNVEKEINYQYEVSKQDAVEIMNIFGSEILTPDEYNIIRVRIKGDKGYLTIKGKQIGILKPEYEYEIKRDDVNKLMEICSEKLEKTRYEIKIKDNLKWEIDYFKGQNKGLVLAEIELLNENITEYIPYENEIDIRDYIEMDVSTDSNYSNSNLAKIQNKKFKY